VFIRVLNEVHKRHSFLFLSQSRAQRCHLPRAFFVKLLRQVIPQLLTLCVPVAKTALVLRFQLLGCLVQAPRIGQPIFDFVTTFCDDIEDRPVKKMFQNPDEDQKINNLEQKSGSAQFQVNFLCSWLSCDAALPCYWTRYSSNGLRNSTISTMTST